MSVAVITGPAAFVTVAEAKSFLREDWDDQDTLIGSLIAAACAHVDGPAGWLGRCIGTQTLELTAAGFGCERYLELPYPPASAVSSIVYRDAAGDEQTLDAENYLLVGNTVWLASGASWPAPGEWADAVKVTYTAGYASAPEPVKVAVLMHVAQLYRQREAVSAESVAVVPMGYEAMLSPYHVKNV